MMVKNMQRSRDKNLSILGPSTNRKQPRQRSCAKKKSSIKTTTLKIKPNSYVIAGVLINLNCFELN